MDGLGTLGAVIGSLGGLMVAGVGGFMFARRRLSRDGVELVKDRAEINVVEQLTKQRDEALAEKNMATDEKNSSRQEMEALRKDLEIAKKQVEDMKAQTELLEELTGRLGVALENAKKQMQLVARHAKEGAGQ